MLLHGFALLYNPLAPTYELVALLVSAGHWPAWRRAALAYLPADPAARLLEIGPGPGVVLAELVAQGRPVWALERSARMVAMARRRLRRAGLRAELIRGQAESLPFAAGAFDAVLLTFPAPFIVDRRTLAELRRVLRPGGQVVVADSAHLGKGEREGAAAPVNRLLGHPGPRVVLPDPIAERFARAGFAVRRIERPVGNSVVRILIAESASAGDA